MKFLLGTKEYMTQIFDTEGRVHPATVVATGPLTVIAVKTPKRDGYSAVQVGFGTRAEKNISKSVLGHTKPHGNFAYLKEFRITPEEASRYSVGTALNASVFSAGDVVRVSGTSKGKGFQGVVKRHGFHGGRRSHGQKHSEREPGSIGAGGVQRVFKGTRMGGRMGGDRVTVSNLRVLETTKDGALIVISGAIPGRRGTLVEIIG